MALYALAMVYASAVILQLTPVVILVILGVLALRGYAMFPASVHSEAHDTSDLPANTINRQHQLIKFSQIVDAEIGEGTVLRDHVNLYKCKIGRNCKIESFVYIEEGVTVGDDCKIKPHVYLPTGVVIEDQVFVGPNVTFTNDKYPRVSGEWTLLTTIVRRGASIGAHSVILPGVTIGRNAVVGAGSVVTTDISDGTTVCGNPARPVLKQ